jgi:putative CocE/NonD family hydrolase
VQYLKEHVKRRRGAEHYLVIGPYDHFGTHSRNKPANLRDYEIDAAAKFDSQELKMGFMDYVLRGGDKPKLLEENINYQVMGANEWRHVPTLAAMHPDTKRLYFSQQKREGVMSLDGAAPAADSFVTHTVDFAERVKFHGAHSYPAPIVQGPLSQPTEAIFVTEPFKDGTTVSGPFAGELLVSINKKDFDLGVTVYEAHTDGSLFHLGYAMQRASFAGDPTKRKLLTPGKPTRVAFETTLVSRRMAAGSRLLVLVDGIKHPMAQINYGTGKDVSDESIKDAGDPLEMKILSGSYVDVPLDK